jgi:hypothetical protein
MLESPINARSNDEYINYIVPGYAIAGIFQGDSSRRERERERERAPK